MIDIIYIGLGIGLLYLGGELLLSGALSASVRMGISKVLASVVLMGFGTSAPELFVSFQAVIKDGTDIAVGNVMGSNMANILLIAGLGMLLAPLYHRISHIGTESVFFVVSAFIPLIAMGVFGGMAMAISVLGVLLLMVYFVLVLNRPYTTEPDTDFTHMSVYKIGLFVVGGLAMLVIGADVLINSAIAIATKLGVSQAIIGVSMVAVGTSLPEIATTISAARRQQGEMIIGNVLGSNLFNTLLVLAGVGLYQMIPISQADFLIETVVLPIISLILVGAIYTKKCIRITGICALCAYAVYVVSWGGIL